MGTFDDKSNRAPFSMVFDPAIPSAQLPFRYQVLRERARLKTCCYWLEPEDSRDAEQQVIEDGIANTSAEEPFIFEFVGVSIPKGTLTGPLRSFQEISNQERQLPAEINQEQDITVIGGWSHLENPAFYITPVTFKPVLINGFTSIPTRCQKQGADVWHQGNDGFPPCNGSKTECPFYTGPKFLYVNDEDLYINEDIAGEQIQELRSFIKNWDEYNDPQLAWNNTFKDPEIYARAYIPGEDVDDRIAKTVDIDGRQSQVSEMTRIRWDFDSDSAVKTKVFSNPPGISESTADGTLSPPDFYSLIINLGLGVTPLVRITFPFREDNNKRPNDDLKEQNEPVKFTYEHSEISSNIIYIAGESRPQSILYIINTTINKSFPFNGTGQLEDPKVLDPLIEDLVKKYFSREGLFGFHIVKADNTGFWENFFVDLVVGTNNLVVVTKVDGQWGFSRAIINYKLYHMEFIQQGFKASLPDPTIGFINYIANSRPQDPITFQGFQMGKDRARIDSIYHFYVQERDLFRICNEDNPNKRTFNITFEEVEEEEVKFKRLGRCNEFMCEIVGRNIPTISPLGMDRSLEIDKIKFVAFIARNSGHTRFLEEVEVDMEVVPDKGRNLRGIGLPVRFFKVRPIGDVDLRKVDEDTSRMLVTYRIFRAESIAEGALEGRQEDTKNLLETFGDSSFSEGNVGGVSIFNLLDESTEPDSSIMITPTVIGDLINVGQPNKQDLSFVVQYTSETGNIIGRKWIYGVVELSRFWARDIEIRYSWCSDYSTITTLLPRYRKFGLDTPFGQLNDRHETIEGRCRRTNCGDHETSNLGEGGPSFFPYDSCAQPLYTNRDVARWLFQPVPDAQPVDEKYRAPDRYDYRTLEHHVFGFIRPDCFFEWTLGTIQNYGSNFNGWSRERGPISPFIRPSLWFRYIILGWNLPPLGNRGREAIRVYKSMHYRQYIYKCGNTNCGFCVRLGWLPALPYASPPDFMITNSPRTILDQTTNGGSFERKTWNEIFYIRNTVEPDTQGRPDQPIQWPRTGFYPSFRKANYIWAWSERSLPLVRVDSLITGVRINKPTGIINGSNQGFVGKDAFDRPINFHLEEDQGPYQIRLVPESYEAPGQYRERAYLVIGNEGEKLYFNEFTGQIEDNSGAAQVNRDQLYTFTDKQDILDAGIDPSLTPIYDEQVGQAGANPPNSLSDSVDYIITGNLIRNINSMSLFLSSADILDGSGDIYACYFPSLEVTGIFPKYLPKEEIGLEDKDDLFPLININPYPDINPGININRNFSNQLIPNSRARIIGGQGPLDWRPAEFPGFSSFNKDGQTSGVTVVILLDRRVRISKVKFEYEVYGGVDLISTQHPKPPTKPSMDPSIRLRAINSIESFEKELINKPRFNGPPNFVAQGFNPIKRSFEFIEEFEDLNFYNRLEIDIGNRNADTGFRINLIDIDALFITNAEEIISINEAKYNVESIELSSRPVPFIYPAEDDFELSKFYKIPYAEDVSDLIELQGVAEFWQPGRASLTKDDIVGTLGKLRRAWANGWDSIDIRLHLGEIEAKYQYEKTVYGGDVQEDHENRQAILIDSTLKQAIDTGLLDEETIVTYITESDRIQYSFIQGKTGEDVTLPYENRDVVFNAGLQSFRENLFENIVYSVGDREPGWQAEGFWACLGERASTTILSSPFVGFCSNLGGGAFGVYTPEWNTTHGVCGDNVGDPTSDNPNYFGGISIGDLGLYQARRLLLSGGDAARSFADPGSALSQFDGNVGSVQQAREQDVTQEFIPAVGQQSFFNNKGLPDPTQNIRGARG